MFSTQLQPKANSSLTKIITFGWRFMANKSLYAINIYIYIYVLKLEKERHEEHKKVEEKHVYWSNRNKV